MAYLEMEVEGKTIEGMFYGLSIVMKKRKRISVQGGVKNSWPGKISAFLLLLICWVILRFF